MITALIVAAAGAGCAPPAEPPRAAPAPVIAPAGTDEPTGVTLPAPARPPTAAAVPVAPPAPLADSAEVAEIVERFHAALAAGDSAAALALLTPDVVVLESGGSETREEYRSHHLPADIAFARAVPRERGPIRVTVRGDAAWAASTSTSRGTFRDRQINSSGAELMVLVRTPEGWRIAAIHWSSRSRPA